MTIDAEKLSAFLDNELDAEQTKHVRQLLEHDEQAAALLAAMVMVDERIYQHVEQQQQIPMADSIHQLLAEHQPAQVIVGPWQKARQLAQRHLAMAASLTMVVGLAGGLGLAQMANPNNDRRIAQAVEQVLETQPSGQSYPLGSTLTMTPKLLFKHHNGQYCRHYELENQQQQSITTAIQCRDNGTWQTVASATRFQVMVNEGYQTASSDQMLDPVLDSIMASAPFTEATENAVINAQWGANAAKEESL
ncbi:hypothetical protein [Pseudidiomarina mangrovi]|uniref:hypothetical protein n=1 Tax=Pseudidiomarina mangrovi TaxID=2487133 RepID=UPI000FCC780C|nr:hypothetical protein [Pseudidiomarina mangrovi]